MQSHSEPLANQIPDVCRRLGIGRTLLYEIIKSGQIRTIKIGNRTLVPESELCRFVNSQLEKATA
jgi:excisionase family DNA binding protein